jgi:hypothetical protein
LDKGSLAAARLAAGAIEMSCSSKSTVSTVSAAGAAAKKGDMGDVDESEGEEENKNSTDDPYFNYPANSLLGIIEGAVINHLTIKIKTEGGDTLSLTVRTSFLLFSLLYIAPRWCWSLHL